MRKRSHVRATIIGYIAVLAVGLSIPALAAAEWTAPVDLSAAEQPAFQHQVAVDADGDAVFAWTGGNDLAGLRIHARTLSAGGALGAVQTLSGPGLSVDPQVAVDADGDAVFTWERSDGTDTRVQARARSAAGALSGVRDLSGPGQDAVAPQVAVDADGDAVFTWQRFDAAGNTRVQARARSAAGALSGVRDLSGPGQDAVAPQVAVDTDGDAVFTWQRFDAAGNTRVQARARSAAGALSGVRDLSGPGLSASRPKVAVDADGDAVFTWRRFDGANTRVQARARSAAGALSAVQTLSGPGQDAFEPPQVAVDADGDAVFAWGRYDAAGNTRVQARARSAAGALSAVHTLSEAGGHAFDPQVAVDADGDAVATWFDGADARVQASAGP